jgi:hypothetical protein
MSSTDDFRLFQVLNIIAVLFSIIMNSLANILPFFGVNTGEVSDAFPNFFTPIGNTFVIWGVIYSLLLLFMVYQARPSQRSEAYLKEIGVLYLLGALLNVGWLILFHYTAVVPFMIVVTILPIGLFFLVLLWTYLRLGIGVKEVPRGVKLAVHLPVSVYLGWISVATVANIAAALNWLIPGIPADLQQILTVVVLGVVLLIAELVVIRRRDFAYGLVIVWAAIGIAWKWTTIPLLFFGAVAVALIVFFTIILLPFIMKKKITDFYMIRN